MPILMNCINKRYFIAPRLCVGERKHIIKHSRRRVSTSRLIPGRDAHLIHLDDAVNLTDKPEAGCKSN